MPHMIAAASTVVIAIVVTDEAASHPHLSTPIFNEGLTSSQHPVIVDTIINIQAMVTNIAMGHAKLEYNSILTWIIVVAIG